MNEKFFDLAREKQDRMINGAVEVFAKNGYKHASTDDMVKAAGISKGLWFHYFGSKEGIYVFVYDYCVKFMVLELSTVVDGSERDYFELLKQIVYTKIKVYKNYPYLEAFLEGAANEAFREVAEKTAQSRQAYEERMAGLLKNAEMDTTQDRVKRERIKKLLDYGISGIMREKMREQAEGEVIYREIKAYIDLVKDMAQNLP